MNPLDVFPDPTDEPENAVAEPLDERFGRVAGAGRQRLPGEGGFDGFYYARLRKRPA